MEEENLVNMPRGCFILRRPRFHTGVARPNPNEGNLPWNSKCFWLNYYGGSYHPRSVFVGYDKDGGDLYVGRMPYNGGILPGKVVPNHRCCYAADSDQEISASNYEVLVLGSGVVEWQTASDGDVPASALPTGYTKDGEVTFTVRVPIDGTITPGKLIPSKGVCCISYDCKEFTFKEYEVLAIL